MYCLHDRPRLFCTLIACAFALLIGIDRLAPIVLPPQAYHFRPWIYMTGAFRYDQPRKNERMVMNGYGDLANMLGVPKYRIVRPFVWTNDAYGFRNTTATQHDRADIVVIGDSFMANAADSDETAFVTQLQSKRQSSVTAAVPLDMSRFLAEQRFLQAPPKIVIWGRVERNLSGDNGEIQKLWSDTSCFSDPPSVLTQAKRIVKSGIGGFVEYARLSVVNRFSNQMIKLLVYRITGSPLDSEVWLHENPAQMLFLRKGAQLAERSADKRGYDQTVQAVAHARECLAKRGTTLMFLPIPDKEHIYSSFAGIVPPKEDPLQRMIDLTQKENIEVVSLLRPFLREKTHLLYWPDDTHWNAEGIRIAVEATTAVLDHMEIR
ncbi:MAG: hypothetical protein V1926_05670 [Candidatus Peregrinibacteria bacterium]